MRAATLRLDKADRDLAAANRTLESAKADKAAKDRLATDADAEALRATNLASTRASASRRTVQAMSPKTWARLKADASKSAAAQKLLAAYVGKYDSLFSDLTDPVEPADIIGNPAIEAKLNDRAANMAVWINDRTYYTTPFWTAPDPLPDDKINMENFRGGWHIGNDKLTRDKQTIQRPWIPIECAMPLLSKSDPLYRASMPDMTDAMRRAAGP